MNTHKSDNKSRRMMNAYICDNLHCTVTIDREPGTTPMMIECPECKERSISRMYHVNQTLKPTHEWIKPTPVDIELEIKNYENVVSVETLVRLRHNMVEHVKNGGLIIRKIKK